MLPITDERVLELARRSMAPRMLPDDDVLLAFARALLAEIAGNEIVERLPVPEVIELWPAVQS